MIFYLRILLHLLGIFFLFVFQTSFIDVLPSWISELNLYLIVLIFILFLYGRGYAFFWGVALGVLLDLYSFLGFGVFVATFALTVVFIHIMAYNFFTNRSLYSFWGLILLATIFYEFSLRIIYHLVHVFTGEVPLFLSQKYFWITLGQEMIMNAVAILFFFYIFNFVSNRFRPVFIRR